MQSTISHEPTNINHHIQTYRPRRFTLQRKKIPENDSRSDLLEQPITFLFSDIIRRNGVMDPPNFCGMNDNQPEGQAQAVAVDITNPSGE